MSWRTTWKLRVPYAIRLLVQRVALIAYPTVVFGDPKWDQLFSGLSNLVGRGKLSIGDAFGYSRHRLTLNIMRLDYRVSSFVPSRNLWNRTGF